MNKNNINMNKNNIIKFNDMKNHSATDKQLKYINDLCSDNGYEFYNQDINMKQAASIIGFLAKDKVLSLIHI